MREEDFSAESPGTLVDTLDGAKAFLPDPPPSDLPLAAATVSSVCAARAAIGALRVGVQALPNANLLIRPFRTQEAVYSNQIEGTQTTVDEAMVDQVVGLPDDERGDRRDVQNYDQTLSLGVQALRDGRPLSMHLIRELHRKLLTGTLGSTMSPGEVRTEQVWLGPEASRSNIHLSRFVPPPHRHVPTCLDDLVTFLDTQSLDDALVRVAIAHYQFETIHPFKDGNGRVGRLLIVLQMISEGLLPEPWLYVSEAIARRKEEYQGALYRVSALNEMDAWIRFFAGVVTESASATTRRLDGLTALRGDFTERLRRYNTRRPLALIESLFETPYLTTKIAQGVLDDSAVTAGNTIKRLEEVGILHRLERTFHSGSGRPYYVWFCPEVYEVVSG